MCCGEALFELSLTADLWRQPLVVFLSWSGKCPVLAALNVSSSPSPTFPFLMWRLAQSILPCNNPFPFLFLLCLVQVFHGSFFFSLKCLTYKEMTLSSSLFKYCSEKMTSATHPAWGSNLWGWALLLCVTQGYGFFSITCWDSSDTVISHVTLLTELCDCLWPGGFPLSSLSGKHSLRNL